MFTLTVITTILTTLSVIFAGIPIWKLSSSQRNINKNSKKLYLQKIKDNKTYIKNNLSSLKDSLKRQGLLDENGYDKDKLNNIWILPYYIITLNNSTFERVIKDLIIDTEEIIKTGIDNKEKKLKELTKLHRLLDETYKIMQNGNYLINILFHDYDNEIQKNMAIISKRDKFDNKVCNDTLYTPPGDQNTLIYTTPIIFYNSQISNIMQHLKHSPENDIQYISINDYGKEQKSSSLMDALKIDKIFKNLDEIIKTVDDIESN
ncbi:hypothetical protein [Staphylococcus saprophyticus]|uniref:hypothetical protein n=1 Tax=Staphylococcus saprophyticus TaxID=29385 RepID=UPI00384D90A8